MRFSSYRADLLRGPLSYEEVLRDKGIVGTPDFVAARIAELRETARLDGDLGRDQPRQHAVARASDESLRLYCREVMPRFK